LVKRFVKMFDNYCDVVVSRNRKLEEKVML